MARMEKPLSTHEAPRGGRIARMQSAIAQTARQLGAKIRHPLKRELPAVEAAPAKSARPHPVPHAARPVQRKTDVPIDLVTYAPRQTSRKGPFRATGEDHERDQELAGGFADERFKEEDRFTNRSGDPRIGTHNRRYEERDEVRGGR